MQLTFKKYFNNNSFYSGDKVRTDIHIFHVSLLEKLIEKDISNF